MNKAYRTKEQLIVDLQAKFPDIPVDYFTQVDTQWRRKAELTLEFKRRMEKKKAKRLQKVQRAKEEAANAAKTREKTAGGLKQAVKSQRGKPQASGGKVAQ